MLFDGFNFADAMTSNRPQSYSCCYVNKYYSDKTLSQRMIFCHLLFNIIRKQRRRKMPCLKILTNLPKSGVPSDFVNNIIPLLSKVVNKPAEVS